MNIVFEFLKTDEFLLGISIGMIILFVLFLILCYKLFSINNKYSKFMKKLGNGEDIKDDLDTFLHIVKRVESQNLDICSNIKSIEKNVEKCVQKIGIVRYSAFRDTGSDLSFAVALLDDMNNGVVFNGIYSREMSNIYSKPVENGKSKYTLSDEEQEAIDKAINDG